MPPRFTEKRREILRLIARLTQQLGRPPTAMELAKALGMTKQSLGEHLAALVHLDLIEPNWQRASLALTATGKREAYAVPILGEIAAGEPVHAEQREDAAAALLADVLDLKPGDYLLTVRGDSMIRLGIFDGDLIAVRPSHECLDGDIAVVLVPGENAATLKRLHRTGNVVTLLSENPLYPPLTYPAEDVQVQGCLVGHVGKPRARRSN